MIRRPPRSTPFPTRRSSDLRRLRVIGERSGEVGVERVEHRGAVERDPGDALRDRAGDGDRKSTRLNSSHLVISYAVFCLKKKKKIVLDAIDESMTALGDEPR